MHAHLPRDSVFSAASCFVLYGSAQGFAQDLFEGFKGVIKVARGTSPRLTALSTEHLVSSMAATLIWCQEQVQISIPPWVHPSNWYVKPA
jgi:hypothetical protein